VCGFALNKDDYLRRLRRTEGQSCGDVLTQISSVTSAPRGVAIGLLSGHLAHCVRSAAGDGDAGGMVEEATRAIERLVRS